MKRTSTTIDTLLNRKQQEDHKQVHATAHLSGYRIDENETKKDVYASFFFSHNALFIFIHDFLASIHKCNNRSVCVCSFERHMVDMQFLRIDLCQF